MQSERKRWYLLLMYNPCKGTDRWTEGVFRSWRWEPRDQTEKWWGAAWSIMSINSRSGRRLRTYVTWLSHLWSESVFLSNSLFGWFLYAFPLPASLLKNREKDEVSTLSQLPVTCGDLKAALYKDRLARGQRDKVKLWTLFIIWFIVEIYTFWFCFRGEMHFVWGPVVHSWWISKACREKKLQEMEVEHPM